MGLKRGWGEIVNYRRGQAERLMNAGSISAKDKLVVDCIMDLALLLIEVLQEKPAEDLGGEIAANRL